MIRWFSPVRVARNLSNWLCARFGHFEGLLEPRCDFCDAWLAPYAEPREYDFSELRYDPPELLPTRVISTSVDRWVPGAVYAIL